jgi:hypothetical protein
VVLRRGRWPDAEAPPPVLCARADFLSTCEGRTNCEQEPSFGKEQIDMERGRSQQDREVIQLRSALEQSERDFDALSEELVSATRALHRVKGDMEQILKQLERVGRRRGYRRF